MNYDTKIMRAEIRYAERQKDYHDAMATKAYQERDPLLSAFHASCARLHEHHAGNIRAQMVIYNFLEHVS